MIEPTDEMVTALLGEVSLIEGEPRAAVAAVLAIVARDHCLERRGHVFHPLRKWPINRGGLHPHYCVSCSDGHAKGSGCINCRQTGYDQTPWPNCQECKP